MLKRSQNNSQEDRPKFRQGSKILQGYRMEIGGQLKSENWRHIDIDDEIKRGCYEETSVIGSTRFFESTAKDEQAPFCILLSDLRDTEYQRWLMFPDLQRFNAYSSINAGAIISGTLHQKLPN